MSIVIVNLLKTVSIHHQQIHTLGLVSTREQRQHIGLKTVAIVKASQRVGRDQLLLADDVEQQDAQRYTDTKARYRKHHLEGTTHQSGNRKEGKSAINGLLLQAFDFSSMDKGMQGRIYDVAVANNRLNHISRTATIYALCIDVEQGVCPVACKRQHNHQHRRKRREHHPGARGQKSRALHRLGIDEPDEARDGKQRKRNRVGNPVGSDAQGGVNPVRERPDHIEEDIGGRCVAEHTEQKLLGVREQGATASCGKYDKNNHAQHKYLDLECLNH